MCLLSLRPGQSEEQLSDLTQNLGTRLVTPSSQTSEEGFTNLTNLFRSQYTTFGLIRPTKPDPRFPHKLVLFTLRPLAQPDCHLGKVQNWI